MSATITLGWVGTALVLVAYAQPTARRLRIVSLLASLVLIVFNGSLGIWSNVALEVALVGVNLVQLARCPRPVPDAQVHHRRASRWRSNRSQPQRPPVAVERPELETVSP